jgi:hypothetical protein
MTNLGPAAQTPASAHLSRLAAIAALVFILAVVIATLPRIPW